MREGGGELWDQAWIMLDYQMIVMVVTVLLVVSNMVLEEGSAVIAFFYGCVLGFFGHLADTRPKLGFNALIAFHVVLLWLCYVGIDGQYHEIDALGWIWLAALVNMSVVGILKLKRASVSSDF
ncbi:MAG: hypothetical protein AAF438_10475 [Pseudomonadota bacterium]